MRLEIKIAGFGGQGVVLAGYILGQEERRSRVHQLNLYRQTIQNDDIGNVVAQLSGPDDVTCSVYGRSRD